MGKQLFPGRPFLNPAGELQCQGRLYAVVK
jgi:hypothetical protein